MAAQMLPTLLGKDASGGVEAERKRRELVDSMRDAMMGHSNPELEALMGAPCLEMLVDATARSSSVLRCAL